MAIARSRATTDALALICVPKWAGTKFTAPTVHRFQWSACKHAAYPATVGSDGNTGRAVAMITTSADVTGAAGKPKRDTMAGSTSMLSCTDLSLTPSRSLAEAYQYAQQSAALAHECGGVAREWYRVNNVGRTQDRRSCITANLSDALVAKSSAVHALPSVVMQASSKNLSGIHLFTSAAAQATFTVAPTDPHASCLLTSLPPVAARGLCEGQPPLEEWQWTMRRTRDGIPHQTKPDTRHRTRDIIERLLERYIHDCAIL